MLHDLAADLLRVGPRPVLPVDRAEVGVADLLRDLAVAALDLGHVGAVAQHAGGAEVDHALLRDRPRGLALPVALGLVLDAHLLHAVGVTLFEGDTVAHLARGAVALLELLPEAHLLRVRGGEHAAHADVERAHLARPVVPEPLADLAPRPLDVLRARRRLRRVLAVGNDVPELHGLAHGSVNLPAIDQDRDVTHRVSRKL